MKRLLPIAMCIGVTALLVPLGMMIMFTMGVIAVADVLVELGSHL